MEQSQTRTQAQPQPQPEPAAGGSRTVMANPPPVSELGEHVAFFAVLLADRPDRVAKVDAMRKEIPWLQVIEAVDGSKLSRGEVQGMVEDGFLRPDRQGSYVDEFIGSRLLSVGNLGAFLSHRAAMGRVAELAGAGPRYGIVLEDDVVLRPGFLEAVSMLVHVCDGLAASGGVVPDLVNLYVFESQRQYFKQFADAEKEAAAGRVPSAALVPTPPGLWGLQCYLMTPAGAAKTLEAMWPMRGAVDEQITRVGLNSLALVGVNVLDGEVVKSYTNTTATLDSVLLGQP